VARIRTIKPEFWVDEQIVELDYVTRLLFIGLWNFVDDEGYIEYKPKRIKMQVFPADDLELSGALRNLLETRRLTKFDSDQGELVQITNWERHQKISHPTPTRFTGIGGPSSVSPPEDSGALGRIPDDSGLKGKEGKGKEEPLSPADADNGSLIPDGWKPTQAHRDKAASLHLDVDREAERFTAYSRRKMRRLKNWNTGFTNWLRKQTEFAAQQQGQLPLRKLGANGRPAPVDWMNR
jgi:hypothetical protein